MVQKYICNNQQYENDYIKNKKIENEKIAQIESLYRNIDGVKKNIKSKITNKKTKLRISIKELENKVNNQNETINEYKIKINNINDKKIKVY